MKLRRPKTLILALIIAVALTILIIVWAAVSPRAPGPGAVLPPPVDVVVTVIEPLPYVPDTFELPGIVEPVRVVEVPAEVAAVVKDIPVTEGAPVEEGVPIIILDDDMFRTDFERARATADFTRIEFERVSDLFKQGAGTQQDLDRARSEMLAAQASLQLARIQLERTTIYAPVGGTLDEVMVEVGEHLTSGTAAARIVQDDFVNVVVMVPEIELPFLKTGDRAAIYSELGDPTSVVHGKISLIRALADERTRATRVEIRVDNSSRRFSSGRIVRARLTRRRLENVIMIPLAAVLPRETGRMVYVEENGVAVERPIKVNLRMIKSPAERPLEPMIQVTEGLQPGERLIVVGQQLVGPGQRVNVISEQPTGQLHFNSEDGGDAR